MNFSDAALRAVFFDLTFFIIVTTIGLNIVFGIIVDTFSELRDEKVSTYMHMAAKYIIYDGLQKCANVVEKHI